MKEAMLGGNIETNPAFATTHWSVVLSARGPASAEQDSALARLCQAYWYPLYAFARRKGYAPHDAQDLTQEFFARLLNSDSLAAVDRSKGRFRSFLLNAMEHFMANEWRRHRTQRRGGGRVLVSLDEFSPEERYRLEPALALSPEKLYERQWAVAFLDEVLGRLRAEHTAAGKVGLFEALKVFLTGEKRPAAYAELAARLGTSEAALKMTVSRLRRRYGELLREEMSVLVNGPEEVDAELRALFAALG